MFLRLTLFDVIKVSHVKLDLARKEGLSLKDYRQHCDPAEVTDVVVDFTDDEAERLAVRLFVPDHMQSLLIVLHLLDTLAHILAQQGDPGLVKILTVTCFHDVTDPFLPEFPLPVENHFRF